VDSHDFFASIARSKFIARWPLMHNTRTENVQEHSHQVTVIAHALALISNQHYGTQLDANRIGMQAAFHDMTEVFTGDLPTPVKYASEELRAAYRVIERAAEDRLLDMLPDSLRDVYCDLICAGHLTPEESVIIKAADTVAAYLKCVEELKAGNQEFALAESSVLGKIMDMQERVPALAYFMDAFVPAFRKTLDHQMRPITTSESFSP